MNFLSLAAAGVVALVSITDPTGDAHGDGTLTPPTSPIYAHSAIFDLQEIDVSPTSVTSDGGDVVNVPATILSVTLGAVDPDDTAPAGFSGVVVDVYLDFADGGSETTLVGPGMLLPLGSGWDYAVRLSPAGAFGVTHNEPAATTPVTPPGAAGQAGQAGEADNEEEAAANSPAVEVADEVAADEGAADDDPDVLGAGDLDLQPLDLQPLALRIDGNRLIVELPIEVSEDVKVYAVTGVYDPFASTSWRPLASTISPWAYSGGEQVVPVIDVLAVDQAAQTKALQTGALPQQLSTGDRGIIWLVLMGLGLLVAITGLWFRQRVVPEARSGLPYGLPPDPEVVALDPVEEREAEELEAEEPEVEELEAEEPVAAVETGAGDGLRAVHDSPADVDTTPRGAKPDAPNPQSPELNLEQDPVQSLEQDQVQDQVQDLEQNLDLNLEQDPVQRPELNEQRDAFSLFGVQLAEDEEEEDDDLLDGVGKRLDDA